MRSVIFLSKFWVLCAAIVLFPLPLFAQDVELQIQSQAAILIDLESNTILYQKNAHQKLYPGSITKLPAALYALKKARDKMDAIATADLDTVGSITKKYSIDKKYKYPPHWQVIGGTHISIHDGEQMSIKDLMYGMLLESANDATNVVAKHICGSVGKFTNELNEYLKGIGCKNTTFKNPHGLHYPHHMTTAYDMGLITCEAMREPELRKILKTCTYTIPATNKRGERVMMNHNKLIFKKSKYYYPFAIAGKPGYTDNAKHTFIAAAKKNNRTLVVVLLKCPKRQSKYEDTIKLFEYGFKQTK